MEEKIKLIKTVLLDVDGVLTDGTIILGNNEELKFFNAHDGMAICYAKKAGLKVGIITDIFIMLYSTRRKKFAMGVT